MTLDAEYQQNAKDDGKKKQKNLSHDFKSSRLQVVAGSVILEGTTCISSKQRQKHHDLNVRFVDTKVLSLCWKWLIHFLQTREIRIPLWQPALPHIHLSASEFSIRRFLIALQQRLLEQHPDLSPDISAHHHKDAQRPQWQHHTNRCLAPLTSLTVPSLPYTHNHGTHFQRQPGLMPRHSYQKSLRVTAPSSYSWTILAERLL